nr:LysR family transcriptional regulator [Aliamphritea spongicola]
MSQPDPGFPAGKQNPGGDQYSAEKLEELTGCKLIERGYHQAVLTKDGEVLLQYARRLLSLSDEAINALNPEEVRGTVRFGIPDDYASLILKEAVQAFASRYPGIRLEIRNDISHNLFKGLENGDLDLALVTQRETDAGGKMLRRDPLVWVADQHFVIPEGRCRWHSTPTAAAFVKTFWMH